ncbi:MAG: thioredoxin family protein [Pirellulaceae bacterium]|nr:thioredoxin family protein [Pirellulaceae bacterium]
MVKTASTMLDIGTQAPKFALPNVDGTIVSEADFSDSAALIVIFMCNHCPFVKHLADALATFGREYQMKGAAVVAISSNDVSKHPEDSPEQMVHESESRGYSFPYLYDEDQSVAKAYRAACTPDFYVFDHDQKLVYRGQFDSSRPDSGVPVTGVDLRTAVDTVLAGDRVSENQTPSIGCNIKWKQGSEPDYFNPAGIA